MPGGQREETVPDKPKSISYYFFFFLFHPDSYRILIGFLAAVLLVPQIVTPDLSTAGRVMLYVMVACMGYAIAAKPAVWITSALKKKLLGEVPKK